MKGRHRGEPSIGVGAVQVQDHQLPPCVCPQDCLALPPESEQGLLSGPSPAQVSWQFPQGSLLGPANSALHLACEGGQRFPPPPLLGPDGTQSPPL